MSPHPSSASPSNLVRMSLRRAEHASLLARKNINTHFDEHGTVTMFVYSASRPRAMTEIMHDTIRERPEGPLNTLSINA